MNKLVSITFYLALFFLMLGTTIWAGLQQNLFTEFSWSTGHMWFKATLVDFYINQLIIAIWAIKLEKSLIAKIVWPILFACFGSMGTAIYIVLKLVANKPLFPRKDS